MSETIPQQSRSSEAFKQAPTEIRELVKQIMEKERKEQHKRARTEIYQTLLEFIKESTP